MTAETKSFSAPDVERARLRAWPQAHRPDALDDLRKGRRLVAVEQGEDRVEVHVRAVLAHDRRDDPVGGALREEGLRDLLDHPARRALGHADRDRSLADDLDVAALQRRLAEVLESEPLVVAELRIPVLERLVLEARVGAIDRGHVVGLAPAGGPVHRVDRDAAVDPARRVAREQAVRQWRQHEERVVVDGGRDERRRCAAGRGRGPTRRRSGRR